MPNIRSAEKRMRSDDKKRQKNQATLTLLKNLNKKLLTLSGDSAKAKDCALEMFRQYDKAVGAGVIPRGRADRKKSRIAAFLKKTSTPAA